MGETFKLNFITNGEGEVVIDEPVGFDSADFTLEQDNKRYGRDVSFSGGESNFEFYRMRNHYLETILYYYETYGWESEVQLIIEIDGIDNIIGDLDFKEAKTDQLEYFKCKVIQQSNHAIIKRREDINVDVFSSEDVDGNTILPLTTENVLIKAKPIKQSSAWETPSAFSENLLSFGSTTSIFYRFNPAINITGYGIDDTLTFFDVSDGKINNEPSNFGDDYKIIEAQNNLRNVTINITNLDFDLQTSVSGSGNGYVEFKLELRYGLEFATAIQYSFFSGQISENQTYTNTSDHTFTIPYLNRGEGVWLSYRYKTRQSATIIIGSGAFNANTTINSMNVGVTATSVSYNTTIPSIRLYDACAKVVESISGLGISFPFADVNGEMYDQRLFSGNLLRNLTDKPFYISFKDITEWLPEINGDYEIGDEVFFGKYEDFYTNNEIAVFTDIRFDDYEKTFNDRYAINQFLYKYKKYQAQKENEVDNTFDVVHGESEWSVLNRFVENKKEASISFVRDSFYISEQIRKAIDLTETTSTQDDDTIFILDTRASISNLTFTETDFLQHTYDTVTGYLKLTNTGNFNFSLLGLAVGEVFQILGGDANAGSYLIIEITDRYIVIDPTNVNISENNNGERNTQFKYIVSTVTAPYISWSNEGFNYINGLTDDDGFANLKYSVKRNVKRFYNQYLATSNFFVGTQIKNTLYKNNPGLSISYEGLQTVEGDPFTPTNPILSPYKHNITLITDFLTYKALEDAVRATRGYVRAYDALGFVIKIYPEKMTFVNSAELGELKMVGEEKYQQSLINIIYANMGYITINDEYRTPSVNYSVDGEKFSIFDEQYRLLYNPVYWNKISINGAFASDKDELEQWLSLIS